MARKSATRKSSKSRSTSKGMRDKPLAARSRRKTERKQEGKGSRRPVARFSSEVRQEALALILRRVPRARPFGSRFVARSGSSSGRGASSDGGKREEGRQPRPRLES